MTGRSNPVAFAVPGLPAARTTYPGIPGARLVLVIVLHPKDVNGTLVEPEQAPQRAA